jgi:hypothetical protein
MKQIIFTIAVLISGFISNLMAQSYPDPDFPLRPYILEADNSLKSLERTDAQIELNLAKSVSLGGTEMYYTTFKTESDVRLSRSSLPKLIIKVEANMDPSELISISKGVVKRDRRRFLQSSSSLMGKARDVSDSYVKAEFKKVRDGIFEMTLPSDIQPGEYAILPSNGGFGMPKVKISCFGID